MLYIADTLSRAPLSTHSADGVETDTEMFMQAVISGIPGSTQMTTEKFSHKTESALS